MVMDDRGQLFTLEGLIAALVVLSSVIFALTTTAATPLSASTSNQHLEVQQGAEAASLLDTSKATGDIEAMVRYWDDDRGAFHDSSSKGYYLACRFDGAMGETLERSFDRRGATCNVNVRYIASNGRLRTERVVYVGEPTDNAVRVTTMVTLYDTDRLVLTDGNDSTVTLENASTFYIPDIDAGPLYNVVEVEVISWRM